MNIDLKSEVICSSAPFSVSVGDELVMADVDVGKYYAFNEIATSIWNGIQKKISIQDLCLKLQDEYEVSSEFCLSEVLTFVNELHQRGLVHVTNPGSMNT